MLAVDGFSFLFIAWCMVEALVKSSDVFCLLHSFINLVINYMESHMTLLLLVMSLMIGNDAVILYIHIYIYLKLSEPSTIFALSPLIMSN